MKDWPTHDYEGGNPMLAADKKSYEPDPKPTKKPKGGKKK